MSTARQAEGIVLNLPELVKMIFDFLSEADIASARYINRTFNLNGFDRQWERPNLERFSHIPADYRQGCASKVRSINIDNFKAPAPLHKSWLRCLDSCRRLTFPRLEEVIVPLRPEFQDFSQISSAAFFQARLHTLALLAFPPSSSLLQTIVHNCIRLRDLEIYINEGSQRLIHGLAMVKSLRRLTLYYSQGQVLDPKQMPPFIAIMDSLQELAFCYYSLYHMHHPVWRGVFEASTLCSYLVQHTLTFSSLKGLRIDLGSSCVNLLIPRLENLAFLRLDLLDENEDVFPSITTLRSLRSLDIVARFSGLRYSTQSFRGLKLLKHLEVLNLGTVKRSKMARCLIDDNLIREVVSEMPALLMLGLSIRNCFTSNFFDDIAQTNPRLEKLFVRTSPNFDWEDLIHSDACLPKLRVLMLHSRARIGGLCHSVYEHLSQRVMGYRTCTAEAHASTKQPLAHIGRMLSMAPKLDHLFLRGNFLSPRLASSVVHLFQCEHGSECCNNPPAYRRGIDDFTFMYNLDEDGPDVFSYSDEDSIDGDEMQYLDDVGFDDDYSEDSDEDDSSVDDEY